MARANPRQGKWAKAAPALPSQLFIEKSAGGVVVRERAEIEFLLLHSSYWEFPKGHIDPEESEPESARREIREETGLEVEFEPGFRSESVYFYRRGPNRIKKQVVYFLAQAAESTVRLSWEHREYIWLPFEQALGKLTYAGSREVLRQAHEHLVSRDSQVEERER